MAADHPDFLDDIADLASAEEFLDYFAIPFDAAVVHVNRLHILQRFHDYLGKQLPAGEAPGYEAYKHWLSVAYRDFVASDAQTEKVFRVFRMHEPQTVFVPLSDVFR